MKKLVASIMVGGLLVAAASAATVQNLAVGASVLPGTSYLLIHGGPMTNLVVQPASTNQYFVTAARTAEYFAANGPWHIRVYTTNANNSLGLVSESSPTNSIILKIWQASMGPVPDGTTGSNGVPATYAGKAYPDPDDNSQWWRNPADERTVCWAIIQDDNVTNMVDYTKIAWSAGSATFNPAPAESEVSPTQFRLAFETFGHKALNDYKSIITYELVIEP